MKPEKTDVTEALEPSDSASCAALPNGRRSQHEAARKAAVLAREALLVYGSVKLIYGGVKLMAWAVKQLGPPLFRHKKADDEPARGAGGGTPFTKQPSTAASSSVPRGADSWSVVNMPPPPVPKDYKPIVSTTLPCSVQAFYTQLLSSSSRFWPQQHADIGKQYNVEVSAWQPASSAGGSDVNDASLLGARSAYEWVLGTPGSGGYSRLLTFVQPKKPPQRADTRCVQRQQFCVYSGDCLVLATGMNMLDIPFKECFTVNTLWRVEPAAEGGCSVTVHLRVQFIKSALGVGGIISGTTFSDTTAFYKEFLRAAAAQVSGAAGSGASPSRAPAAVQGSGASAGSSSLAATMPAWKQLRAVGVFMLLMAVFVHQLSMHAELQLVKHAANIAGSTVSGGGLFSLLGMRR